MDALPRCGWPMGVMCAEVLVHGDDIARAADRQWLVPDEDAWCALSVMTPLLPVFRRPDVLASDTIAFLGPDGDAVRITCDGRHTSVGFGPVVAGDRPVSEAPADVLLGLFGRRPSTPPVADLVERFGPF